MKGMILAAGLGTRFRPHTDKLAKPALPFLNLPLLGYSLYHLETLNGLSDVVLNTHHLAATVREAAAGLTAGRGYGVHFSDEQPKILGSGGGIRRAQKFLTSTGGGHFVVSNGDEVLFFERPGGFRRLVEAHIQSGAIATLMTMDHADVGVTMNGLRVDKSGAITEYSVREKGLAHFTGVFVFSERIFNYMPPLEEFHIFKEVLVPAQKRGEKVLTHHVNDLLWLETTDEKSFIESTDIALDHWARGTAYAAEMKTVFERYNRKLVEMRRGLWAGPGASIGTEVQVNGFSVVGENAKVSGRITLDHTVIAPSVQIEGAGDTFDHRLIL